MRQGHQNNKRMRGRGGRKGGGSNPLQRSYESNGPDVKIRGNALHVAEKYLQLARDAGSSGDRVAEQSYLQHAEHYYRIVAAAQAQMPQQQQAQRNDGDDDRDESYNGRDNDDSAQTNADRDDNRPSRNDQSKPAYGMSEPQPFTNGGSDAGGEDGENATASGENGAGGDDTAPQPAPRRRRAPRQRAPRGEIRVAAEEATAAEE